MQDLITYSEPTMSSLQIAALTGKLHRNVTSDIERILGEAEIDVLRFQRIYQDPMNRSQKCYQLPRRECDLVVSGYSVKYRLAIIDRWQELEAQQRPQEPTWIANLSPQALVVIEDLNNKVEQQQALIEAQKPAVEFVDRYTDSTGLVSLTQAAKDLHFKPRQFTSALQRDGYLYRTGGALTPYQRYIDQGLFHIVVGESSGHGYSQTKITNKGKAYFAQRYASEL